MTYRRLGPKAEKYTYTNVCICVYDEPKVNKEEARRDHKERNIAKEIKGARI